MMIFAAPPTSSLTSEWLAFLTPLALAVLAVSQIITTRLAAKTQNQVMKIADLAERTHTLVKQPRVLP